MAKWGEGDPRWLVEERPDATNPNNWHWVEKNATGWSRDRLTDLFVGQHVESGSLKVKFTEFAKLEGEASTNNRKAKLIFLFEWLLQLKFTANVIGSDTEYKGFVEIPNLSDENEADEVDIVVTVETRGPHEVELRHTLSRDGLRFVRDRCGVYIRELKEEFSKGLILPTDKPKPQAIATKAKTTIVNKKVFQNEVVTTTKPATNTMTKAPTSLKKLSLKEKFKVPPERLYEILTVPELVRGWGGGDALSDPKTGGAFSLVGGQIAGIYIELTENKKIVAKWRLKKYPNDHFANVTFALHDQNDSTDLSIEADGVPEEHFADTQIGFQRYYFSNIIRTFGIGLNLF